MFGKNIITLMTIMHLPLMMIAQDSPISQWCNNVLTSNPSMAGSANTLRANAFYRNQWPKANAGFNYYGVAVDMPVAKNMGCGIELENENASAFAKPRLFCTYSYKTQATRTTSIRYGIKIGALQEYLNTSELTFEQEENIATESSKLRLDAGIGISATINKMFVSFAVEHLTRPQQGLSASIESKTKMKWSFGAGYTYKIKTLTKKKSIEIMPNLLFQRQGTQQNLQLGVISQVNWLMVGIAGRTGFEKYGPTLSILLGYKKLDFTIAYNYDIETNRKIIGMGNAHEISITKLFDIKHKEKHKAIECPSFLR